LYRALIALAIAIIAMSVRRHARGSAFCGRPAESGTDGENTASI
jgi:hypothetical protein